MFTIKSAKSKLFVFLKSRGFVAFILCVMCALSILTVASQTKRITVIDGENSVTILTMKNEPEEILQQAGISVSPEDEIVQASVDADSSYSLEVKRAFDVSVCADGATTNLTVTDGTVSDALARAGVTVGDYDVCNLSLSSELSSGMAISLDRVEYRDITTTESIPYGEERRESNKYAKGKEVIGLYGSNGERTIVTREKLVNGEVVESSVISDEVTKEPVNKIVLVGTKEVQAQQVSISSVPKTESTVKYNANGTIAAVAPVSASWHAKVNGNTLIDHLGNEVSYVKMLEGKATSYYAAPGAKTSTGRLAQYGVVAVDPKKIPYGTKMYICSADGSVVYGYAVAGDTGGGLVRGQVLVDLYYNSINECYWFGGRQMRVYILG